MKKIDIHGKLAAALAASLITAACSENPDGASVLPGMEPEPANVYSVRVGGDSGSAATRAEYDGAEYKWSPGDRVGFYMVPAGGSTPIVSNARFTGVNASAAVTTDFEGELSEASLSQVSPSAAYDYYSYFPYNVNAGSAGFPNVAFTIPNTITLTPDVFPVEYGFMVGGRQTSSAAEKPISWLEDGEQKLGKHIGFSYKHVFAYLQVYLKLNLMTQDIGKIVITCTDGAMSGTAHVNIETGAMTFVASSNSITVNINGGLNVDENPDKGYIWIPVNPALAGKTFKLEFYTTAGNMIDQTITGGTLQAGMKHKAGFRLPFRLSFSNIGSGRTDLGGNNFSFKGYTFGSNGRPSFNGNRVDFTAVSNRPANFLNGGDVDKNNNERGTLRLPALNVANTEGRTSIPVKVKIWGNSEAVADGTKLLGSVRTYSRFYFTGVEPGFTSYLQINSPEGSGYAYVVVKGNAIGYGDIIESAISASSAELSSSKPALALHYVGNYVGAGIPNTGHLDEVLITPAY